MPLDELFTATATAPLTPEHPIKFWDSYILNEQHVFNDSNGNALTEKETAGVQQTLLQFTNNDYRSAHLKKLVGFDNLYSLRVNKKNRLILSTEIIEKQRCAVVHGFMRHDYKTYLYTSQPHAASEYNAKYRAEITAAQKRLSTEAEATAPSAASVPKEMYYSQKVIALTEAQQSAVFDAKSSYTSQVISGAGGAGKSVVLMATMQEALAADPTREIRCITPSRLLTKDLAEKWQDINNPHRDNKNVQFITYEDYIQTLAPAHLKLVDDSAFEIWYSIYLNRQARAEQIKTNKNTQAPTAFRLKEDDLNLLKQTFKLFAGKLFEEHELESIADRDVLFREEGAKQTLSAAYFAWQNHLEETQQLHPAFYSPPPSSFEKKMDSVLVLVDESQDLTWQQIKTIDEHAKQSAEHYAILFNFDSHQISDMYSSERERILQLIKENGGHETRHVRLEGNHRSAPAIVAWADKVVALKYAITHGKTDNHEDAALTPASSGSATTPEDNNALPATLWLKEGAEDVAHVHDLFNFNSTKHIIITHEHLVDEAKKAYSRPGAPGEPDEEPTVLTFQEAKGKEYERVLLYKPFEHKAFYAANKQLKSSTAADASEKSTSARPQNTAKKEEGDRRYTSVFNDVISGALRAQSCLTIVQNPSPKLHKVLQPFTQHTASTLATASLPKPVKEKNSSRAEWVNIIRDWLLQNPNNKAAEQKYRYQHCQRLTGLDFKQFKESILHPITAQPTSSVSNAHPDDVTLEPSPAAKNPAEDMDKKQTAQPTSSTSNTAQEATSLTPSPAARHAVDDQEKRQFVKTALQITQYGSSSLGQPPTNTPQFVAAIHDLIALLTSNSSIIQRLAAGKLKDIMQNQMNHDAIHQADGLRACLRLLSAQDAHITGYVSEALFTYTKYHKREALPLLREANSIQAFISLLNTSDRTTKQNVANTLAMLSCESFGCLTIIASDGIPALLQLFSDSNTITRWAAAIIFLNLTRNHNDPPIILDTQGFQTLLLLCNDLDASIQPIALYALSNLAKNKDNHLAIQEAQGLPTVLVLLQNPRLDVKRMAAKALANLANAKIYSTLQINQSIQTLLPLLNDSDPETRDNAAIALLYFSGNESAYPDIPIVQYMQTLSLILSRPNETMTIAVLKAFANFVVGIHAHTAILTTDDIQAVIPFLNDTDRDMQTTAALVLLRLTVDDRYHPAILAAESIQALIPLLNNTDIETKLYATLALKNLSCHPDSHSTLAAAQNVSAFLPLLSDTDIKIKRYAVITLANLIAIEGDDLINLIAPYTHVFDRLLHENDIQTTHYAKKVLLCLARNGISVSLVGDSDTNEPTDASRTAHFSTTPTSCLTTTPGTLFNKTQTHPASPSKSPLQDTHENDDQNSDHHPTLAEQAHVPQFS